MSAVFLPFPEFHSSVLVKRFPEAKHLKKGVTSVAGAADPSLAHPQWFAVFSNVAPG